MDSSTPRLNHRPVLVVGALLAPLVVAAALVPFRADLAGNNVALLLVIAVVAVAACGDRLAGMLAALSAGAWFDLLLTRPYGQFRIADRADVETTVLLLVVGIAVSELSAWGQRQETRASQAESYAQGIQDAVASVVDEAPPAEVVEQVRGQLIRLLEAEAGRFVDEPEEPDKPDEPGRTSGSRPRLRPDGQIEIDGALCEIELFGLPLSQEIEIPLISAGDCLGRYLITARFDSRPTLSQRLAAVSLAGRATTALAAREKGAQASVIGSANTPT